MLTLRFKMNHCAWVWIWGDTLTGEQQAADCSGCYLLLLNDVNKKAILYRERKREVLLSDRLRLWAIIIMSKSPSGMGKGGGEVILSSSWQHWWCYSNCGLVGRPKEKKKKTKKKTWFLMKMMMKSIFSIFPLSAWLFFALDETHCCRFSSARSRHVASTFIHEGSHFGLSCIFVFCYRFVSFPTARWWCTFLYSVSTM